MNINKLNLFILITIIIFAYTCQASYGIEEANLNNQVYIIVANKLSLFDIDGMPNLNRLIDEGSIGLMNVRGLNGYIGGEGFATINASGKSYANNESSQFYNLTSEYKRIYENRIGPLSGEYDIGNVQMGKLYNQNQNNNYSPYIGALGDSFHKAGLKTAVFGNSDTDEENIRLAGLIPMDSEGLIDYGNLDNILIENIEYPYGLKTDYNRLSKELNEIQEEVSLIVVDTGDLHRLSTYGEFLSLDVFNQKRNLIKKDIDNFIGELRDNVDKSNTLLMVISPNRAEERIDGSRLTPIILWGNDIEKGVLTSPTTNKKGIVTNLDISPTISEFLGISTDNMSGTSIKTIEEDKSIDYIKSINLRINTANKVRTKTLSFYGTISMVIMWILIILFLFNINVNNKIEQIIKSLLLLLYAIPMLLILNSLFNIDNIFKFIVSLIILIGILIVFTKKYDGKKIIFYMTIIYFILIVGDLLLNNSLTRFSILSHDPIIGARYFGIGNEMIGVFLGITVLVIGLLLERYNNRHISVFILLLSVLMVGHPKLGANVGGTLALISTLFYFILLKRDRELSFKNIAIIIGLTGTFIIGLGYVDMFLNLNPTHLGKSLLLLNEKGLSVAQNIINRKVLMNIKLIGSSIWTKVLFTNILVHIIISYVFKGKVEKLLEKGVGKGILSGIVGIIVGLLLNDSGVILSALAMNLITIFLLFMVLEDDEILIKGEVD